MKAVILAAGLGSRLKPLTAQRHKCLTEVNGIPILANTLACLEPSAVTEVVLVVGHLAGQVRDFTESNRGRLGIRYVENTRYAQTNTAASLLLALGALGPVKTPILVIEGDVFFDQGLLDALISHGAENVTMVEKYHPALDGTFVDVDHQLFVTGWWHASRRPRISSLQTNSKP